jgi:hypothetical protein
MRFEHVFEIANSRHQDSRPFLQMRPLGLLLLQLVDAGSCCVKFSPESSSQFCGQLKGAV